MTFWERSLKNVVIKFVQSYIITFFFFQYVQPSDALVVGTIKGVECVLLAR